jgi:CDP-diacylglycerol--glycerol-3-phosphate 3-phosphatidyltransferase
MHCLPNALSVLRLGLGLGFPLFPAGWRAGVVICAALTDLIDGALSRRMHVMSRTGRLLDPIADKVFVFAVVVTLVAEGLLQPWQVLLIGLRDLTVAGGAAWYLWQRNWTACERMRPTLLGKATTGAQFVLLLAVLSYPQPVPVFFLATAILSGLASVDLVAAFIRDKRPTQSLA